MNARLLVKTLKSVTLIPTNAIQHNGQEAFVYVIRNGVASIQTIKVGVAESGMTAVEGVHPGEVVATSSFDKLRNDSKVVPSGQTVLSGTSGSKVP